MQYTLRLQTAIPLAIPCQSYHMNSIKRCALKSNNKHLEYTATAQPLWQIPIVWWVRKMPAFKARAYVNTEDSVLYAYMYILKEYNSKSYTVTVLVCTCMRIQHWNSCIWDNSYMSICGMSFSVRIFHEIILHPNICSVSSVTY